MAEEGLLEAILDAWDRNNRIIVNLLRAVPPGGMEARAVEGSPTVAEMFAHMIYVRAVFLREDIPEFGLGEPRDWIPVRDPEQLAAGLEASARAVGEAFAACVSRGQAMQVHYDHLLFLEHMIWHEGYHHGQIKLALKIAGQPLENKAIGPLTWRVWMNKSDQR
ncbi:MAG: DinB family protein [Acidobacteriaceae bacterium]